MISAQVPGQAPVDPEGWAKFERVLALNNQAFSTHVRGAKNVSVPMAHKEFRWKVDWAAQQKYCKDFAQALFAGSPRIAFAQPSASPLRDGVPAVQAAIDKTFPNCTTPAPDSWTGMQRAITNMNRGTKGKAPIEYLPTREYIDRERKNAHKNFIYLLHRDYLISMSVSAWQQSTVPGVFDRGWVDDKKIDIEQALAQKGVISLASIEAYRHPHRANGCPSETLNGWGSNSFPPDGYGDWMPAALLVFDGDPIKVEYGTYQYGRPDDVSAERSRLGRKGQRFVFARPLKHDLWIDWAKSPVPKEEQRFDENHGIGPRQEIPLPMNYRACVINFDADGTTP